MDIVEQLPPADAFLLSAGTANGGGTGKDASAATGVQSVNSPFSQELAAAVLTIVSQSESVPNFSAGLLDDLKDWITSSPQLVTLAETTLETTAEAIEVSQTDVSAEQIESNLFARILAEAQRVVIENKAEPAIDVTAVVADLVPEQQNDDLDPNPDVLASNWLNAIAQTFVGPPRESETTRDAGSVEEEFAPLEGDHSAARMPQLLANISQLLIAAGAPAPADEATTWNRVRGTDREPGLAVEAPQGGESSSRSIADLTISLPSLGVDSDHPASVPEETRSVDEVAPQPQLAAPLLPAAAAPAPANTPVDPRRAEPRGSQSDSLTGNVGTTETSNQAPSDALAGRGGTGESTLSTTSTSPRLDGETGNGTARATSAATETPVSPPEGGLDNQRVSLPRSDATLISDRSPQVNEGTLSPQDSATFADRLSRFVLQSHESGEQLRVRITPPDLGTIVIQVQSRGDGLSIRMEASSVSSQQLLTDHLPQLHEALQQMGRPAERVEVVRFEGAGSGGVADQNAWAGSGSQGFDRPREREVPRPAEPRREGVANSPPPATTNPLSTDRLKELNVRI